MRPKSTPSRTNHEYIRACSEIIIASLRITRQWSIFVVVVVHSIVDRVQIFYAFLSRLNIIKFYILYIQVYKIIATVTRNYIQILSTKMEYHANTKQKYLEYVIPLSEWIIYRKIKILIDPSLPPQKKRNNTPKFKHLINHRSSIHASLPPVLFDRKQNLAIFPSSMSRLIHWPYHRSPSPPFSPRRWFATLVRLSTD